MDLRNLNRWLKFKNRNTIYPMKQIFSNGTKMVLYNPSRLFSTWFWSDLKYDITAFLNPRQKWLLNKIPNRWMDKDGLVELCLFEILVDYVEGEKGLEMMNYDWSKELSDGFVSEEYVKNSQDTDKDIFDIYNYITKERPNLQKELDDILLSSKGEYDKHNELEKQLENMDTDAMIKIVKMRGYLWT